MASSALKSQHPVNNKLSNTEIVLTSLCAGAIAGAIAKTVIAPFDRTKINFQIRRTPYSTKKALQFIGKTYKKEGFLALWRGNSATMARIVPYAAIQFTSHEQWKRLLHVDPAGYSWTGNSATMAAIQFTSHEQWKRLLHVDPAGTTPYKQFVAGSLAGLTSQSLTYPLDLARARMAVTAKDDYATLRQVFLKIYRDEGIFTFYKGIFPTILGVIPYAGVSFFTYETLKRLYRERVDNSPTPHPIASLGFGAIAGMFGQTSSYPLDIVRRRMQTDTNNIYFSILETLKVIYQHEGIKGGFFKGLSMNWIKGPIAVGISFATYDNTKDILRNVAVDLKYNWINFYK